MDMHLIKATWFRCCLQKQMNIKVCNPGNNSVLKSYHCSNTSKSKIWFKIKQSRMCFFKSKKFVGSVKIVEVL